MVLRQLQQTALAMRVMHAFKNLVCGRGHAGHPISTPYSFSAHLARSYKYLHEALCSKLGRNGRLLRLKALRAFEQAWQQVRDGNGNRLFCGCYGSLLRLNLRHARVQVGKGR